MTRNKQNLRKKARLESNRQFETAAQRGVTISIIHPRQPLVVAPVDKPEGAGWVVTFGAAGVVLAIIALISVVKVIVWAAQKWNW